MSRSRRFVSGIAFLALASTWIALLDAQVLAQIGPGRTAPAIKLKEPTAWRVYQRDASGKAEIPLVLDEAANDAEIVDAIVFLPNGAAQGTKLVDGKLVGVPVGGPYRINCTLKFGGKPASAMVANVYVGDLWVLAGQSNMQGVGDLVDVTPPHPRVMLLGMDGKWGVAEEPLHWLNDSPDPVHSGDPATRAARSAQEHKTRKNGAGLGLPFAAALVESTGVPIGLIACAHGGTSMEEWSPSRKEEGGKSLYGSMLRQIKQAGGKAKGMLWYQGESDALGQGETSQVYPKLFTDFIGAVRADLGQPELPIYFVQIGRCVSGANPKAWNAVQEAQRLIAERVPNTAVVSVVDLELDDGIHVGTHGLIRAGQRLARIAERELFGQAGATTPTFDRVTRGPNNTLTVKFKGVNIGSGRGAPMAGMPGAGRSVTAAGLASLTISPGETHAIGLKPDRHIAGFSVRKADGTNIPLIYEAGVRKARDTVILKLAGPIPEKAALWYGYGTDPYCNLTDGLDMAVPVFGPITLDEPGRAGSAVAREDVKSRPIKLLIITGDHGHAWKDTTKILSDVLGAGERIKVDVTTTPSKDLTDANLANYDVLLLNYKDTPRGAPETRWSDANKEAFLKAIRDGKGLVVFHHASSAFIKPNWDEFEKAIAGGWRSQGYHGPKHVFTVKKTGVKHPISEGMNPEFIHAIDELYQNSVMVPGSIVLATAYSDPNKPRGTGKDEPVIWVNNYGTGRVYENVLGHDAEAMADPEFQNWMRRGVIWAATGKVD
jgi:sialate O-acetylesterase